MFLLDYKIIYIYNFKGDNQTHENKLIFQKKKSYFLVNILGQMKISENFMWLMSLKQGVSVWVKILIPHW